jgi:hypothetical protein
MEKLQRAYQESITEAMKTNGAGQGGELFKDK